MAILVGAAVARRFAKGGYTICICRRDGGALPLFSRAYSAAATACAVNTAVVLSQTMVRIICGRFVTGCDWISAKPESP